jgi:hypothetical protein
MTNFKFSAAKELNEWFFQMRKTAVSYMQDCPPMVRVERMVEYGKKMSSRRDSEHKTHHEEGSTHLHNSE